MREWFTISELRAAAMAMLTEDFFNLLIAEYPNLSSNQARKRYYPGTSAFQLEFHRSLFMQSEQAAVRRARDGGAAIP